MKMTNPFAAPGCEETISKEELKYFGYGIFMPILTLLLAHSVLAVVSVQMLVFIVQMNIDKERAVMTAKLAGITSITAVLGFAILALT